MSICHCGWVHSATCPKIVTDCCCQQLCIVCAISTAATSVCAACGAVCSRLKLSEEGKQKIAREAGRSNTKYCGATRRRQLDTARSSSSLHEHFLAHDMCDGDEKKRRVVLAVASGEEKMVCALVEGQQPTRADEEVFVRMCMLMSVVTVQGARPLATEPILLKKEYYNCCSGDDSLLTPRHPTLMLCGARNARPTRSATGGRHQIFWKTLTKLVSASRSSQPEYCTCKMNSCHS